MMEESKTHYKHAPYMKGYNFERQIWNMLDLAGTKYESNPADFNEWKKQTATGYDIKVHTRRKGWISVECKFVSKPIYHSWVVRDWVSRTADIIVTNNKWNVSYDDRKLLREQRKRVLNDYELYNYLMEMNLKEKGNKYKVLEYVSSDYKSSNEPVNRETITEDHVSSSENCKTFLDYPTENEEERSIPPLKYFDIDNCLFCINFYVCNKVYRFSPAYQELREMYDFYLKDLDDFFRYGTNECFQTAYDKLVGCSNRRLYLYKKKKYYHLFIRELPLDETRKRRQYLFSRATTPCHSPVPSSREEDQSEEGEKNG